MSIKVDFDDLYKISLLFSACFNDVIIFFFRDILDFLEFEYIVILIVYKIYRKMSISQTQLQKIAEKLSKIPGDNSALLWNLTDILKYMELLNEVDTRWIPATVSVVDNNACLREDVKREKNTSPQELLNCSAQKVVAGNIILPNIMN